MPPDERQLIRGCKSLTTEKGLDRDSSRQDDGEDGGGETTWFTPCIAA